MGEVRQPAAPGPAPSRSSLPARVGSYGLDRLRRALRMPTVGAVPDGRMVELPGRGTTFVVDTGPPTHDLGGPPVILLHGLACTGLLNWYPCLPDLARHHRLVIPDQRWHGHGIRSPRFRLADCADDVTALADVLGIDRFVPAGYSMGSLVAQLVWHRHRERVAGMVLAASTDNVAGSARRQQAVALVGTRVAWLAAHRRDLSVGPVDENRDDRWAWRQFRSTTGREIAGAAAAIARFDSRPWIDGVDVPTAVIVTERDRLLRPDGQRDLLRRIAGSVPFPIPAGHAACAMQTSTFVPAMVAACAAVTRN